MIFYGAILLIDHFINSLNQFRSVENCLDMFKIDLNFEKEKENFFWNFKNRVGILSYSKNWRWRTTKQHIFWGLMEL